MIRKILFHFLFLTENYSALQLRKRKELLLRNCCLLIFLCFAAFGTNAQDRLVTGVVLSQEEDKPISGASVMAKGMKMGTVTDADGKFSLKLPPQSKTIVFTVVGYGMKEIALTSESDLKIQLTAESRQLNEVVITGYSSQRKKDYTGAAARISGAEIADRPVPSFDQALAGQASGVSIISNGGALNAAPVFRIRGVNSIQLSSYPLIVIDGITAFTGDVGNTAQNNPLADLNPADIESIDILKDASATAIYGSRAANGVVVITTKKGKKGKAKVNYDGWFGVNTKPILPEVLNAAEYVMIKNEALANVGSAPAYKLQTMADGSLIDTRWYDYIYQTGKSHNHNLSISGATDATSYFVSLGYSDQEGFMVKNTFNRKSIRLNLDHKLTDRITIGTNSTFSNSINSNLTSGINAAFSLNNLARMAMVLPPNLSPFNEDGTYNVVGNSIGYGANTILTGYYNLMPLVDHDEFTSEGNDFRRRARTPDRGPRRAPPDADLPVPRPGPAAGVDRPHRPVREPRDLGRPPPGDATNQAGYLHERVGGSIGSLRALIGDATARAILTGHETLTRTLLDQTPTDHRAETARRSVPPPDTQPVRRRRRAHP